MVLQPNLLAVNTLPPVFATKAPATEPEAAQEQAPATPVKQIVDGFFTSPLLKFDNQALALIFQVRDSESGEVQRQFPRESVVERLRSNPEVRNIEVPDTRGEDAEAPAPEIVTGAGATDSSETAGTDTVAVVGGTEVANGAPAIGGTSSGASPALVSSGQGVDFLV